MGTINQRDFNDDKKEETGSVENTASENSSETTPNSTGPVPSEEESKPEPEEQKKDQVNEFFGRDPFKDKESFEQVGADTIKIENADRGTMDKLPEDTPHFTIKVVEVGSREEKDRTASAFGLMVTANGISPAKMADILVKTAMSKSPEAHVIKSILHAIKLAEVLSGLPEDIRNLISNLLMFDSAINRVANSRGEEKKEEKKEEVKEPAAQ